MFQIWWLHSMNARPSIFLVVWCARFRNSLSARTFFSNCFYGSFIFIAAFIWCPLVRLWVAFTFLFLLSDSILRCVYFALVSSVLVDRYGLLSCLIFFSGVLSCRCQKHKAMLEYPVLWYSCSPQDPSCLPWEPWPLEVSVGPKWFCGTGSSGGKSFPKLM